MSPILNSWGMQSLFSLFVNLIAHCCFQCSIAAKFARFVVDMIMSQPNTSCAGESFYVMWNVVLTAHRVAWICCSIVKALMTWFHLCYWKCCCMDLMSLELPGFWSCSWYQAISCYCSLIGMSIYYCITWWISLDERIVDNSTDAGLASLEECRHLLGQTGLFRSWKGRNQLP